MTSVGSDSVALEQGERQLWSGVPKQGLMLRAADAIMIPFSCLWAGFALFWEVTIVRTPAPGFLVLWGIPFVAIGAYITVGRFFVDSWRRARTRYGLTSERIIIRSGGSTKSLNLRTLTDVTLTERGDGRGTITFGASAFPMAMFAGASWPGIPQASAFESIPDARKVYAQIRVAQSSGARAS
jgi:hypothetical protein